MSIGAALLGAVGMGGTAYAASTVIVSQVLSVVAHPRARGELAVGAEEVLARAALASPMPVLEK
ncbi:hypothetical protein [Streptomyces melanogenes]|uniref:hypothetical protein n=1 Tax=Streptomyces melanogenes TaxID=67326 RepID=UPI0037903FD0